jgi:hypothetical protein
MNQTTPLNQITPVYQVLLKASFCWQPSPMIKSTKVNQTTPAYQLLPVVQHLLANQHLPVSISSDRNNKDELDNAGVPAIASVSAFV